MASNDTVELLAGGIAHDFDALLNVIVGLSRRMPRCRSIC